MEYEVVVVGGGIGGLTVAALLAARGVSVALLERQSYVGGCAANFEFQGYTFEPTSGLYTGWEPGGIHEQIFAELSVGPPEVRPLAPAYLVRLPEGTEVVVAEETEAFENNLCRAFPECSDAAVAFYRTLEHVAEQFKESINNPTAGALGKQIAAPYLTGTSHRFQSFIDAQLQLFDHCPSDQCSYLAAAMSLTAGRRGMWAIRGGSQTLADRLAESLKKSGGSLRLNCPVLRLVYDAGCLPIGVDLLSGERVVVTRAIISNLTVWDTYGKLFGLNRTPASVSAQLKRLEGCGAYLMFLSMDQSAAERLRVDRTILAGDESAAEPMMLAAAPEWDPRAPEGKRAVTVWTHADHEDWFAFHQDESEHEEQDQAMLERLWARLHAAMPELGDGVEVIETATPKTLHETTRRRLGTVGGLCSTPERLSTVTNLQRTPLSNVFLVGDTVAAGNTIEAVSSSALMLADHFTSPFRRNQPAQD